MTIFHFSLAVAGTIALLSPTSAVAQAQTPTTEKFEDCTDFGRQGAVAEYQCVDRNNKRKEQRLEDSFQRARSFVDEHQNTEIQDTRRSPIYLEWSQAPWKEYVEQNCTVIAGLNGGSNAWVTRYWLDCYSEELDRRIKLLDDIAAGKVGED